jgi:hypothetical protein
MLLVGARGALGCLIGHSVPSTIILAVGNIALMSVGAKYLTKLPGGQLFASLHCHDMKSIHE